MTDVELITRKARLILQDLDDLQSFIEMGRIAVLPPAFAQKMAPSAGLRNRLVHEYDLIDPVRLHEALQSAVEDIPEYLRHVMARVAP